MGEGKGERGSQGRSEEGEEEERGKGGRERGEEEEQEKGGKGGRGYPAACKVSTPEAWHTKARPSRHTISVTSRTQARTVASPGPCGPSSRTQLRKSSSMLHEPSFSTKRCKTWRLSLRIGTRTVSGATALPAPGDTATTVASTCLVKSPSGTTTGRRRGQAASFSTHCHAQSGQSVQVSCGRAAYA